MAKMVPDWSDSDLNLAIPDKRRGGYWERMLYRFMRDELPQDWTVVYNTYLEVICQADYREDYRLCPAPPTMEFRENQFDFLVFVRGKGVVNVDAKGPGYRRTGLNDVRLGGDVNNHNVFQRAKDAIFTFDRFVRQLFHVRPEQHWGAFGSLVVFCDRRDYPHPQGICFYGVPDDLRRGTRRLERKILEVLGPTENRKKSWENFPTYEEDLLNEFKAVACTNVEYPTDYELLDEYARNGLSVEQADIHDMIMEEKQYVWVRGGAGTGKTILGKKCAEQFADAGQRVLYVCFNKVLAQFLGRGNTRKNIVYSHYDGLPEALKLGDLREYTGGKIDWTKTRRRMLDELKNRMRQRGVEKFNVVIVDEAQDIGKSMMALFPRLMVGDERQRHVIILSDSGQEIYRQADAWNQDDLERGFPGIAIPDELVKNFRNTDKIYRHFADATVISMKPQLRDGRIHVNGEPYRIPEVAEEEIKVETLLSKYLQDGTRRYSDIAILACSTNSLNQLPRKIQLGENKSVSITDTFGDWIDNKTVYKSTIHSFKGLEANCIILIDDFNLITPSEQSELRERFGDVQVDDQKEFLRYVGESRAKFKLIITKCV